jgi:hypothetical protein
LQNFVSHPLTAVSPLSINTFGSTIHLHDLGVVVDLSVFVE